VADADARRDAVLTFLLIAGRDGGPLPATAVAELERVPRGALSHEPETVTRWLSKGDRVGVAAWQTRPGVHGGTHWHVGEHGLTLFAGTPWPTRSWAAPTGWAFELTDRLERDLHGTLVGLGGSWSLLRLDPDGAGLATGGALGGPVWVAERGGLTVVSNRAAVAATALGAPATRTADAALARLVTAGTTGPLAPYLGLRRLGAGDVLTIGPDHAPEVRSEGVAWHRTADAESAAAAVRSAVRSAAETSAVARFVDLSADPGALVVAAAVRDTGTQERFRFRVVGDSYDTEVARRLADHLGVHLETDHEEDLPSDIEPLALWVRQRIGRTEGTVSPHLLAGVRASDGALVVRSAYGHAFAGLPATAGSSLREGADQLAGEAERRRTAAESRAGGTEDTLPSRRALALDLPTLAAAEEAVLGAALRVDPLHHADVAALAADRGAAGLAELVMALDPDTAALQLPSRDQPADSPPWRAFAPLVEAFGIGHAVTHLDHLVDPAVVRTAVRDDAPPAAVRAELWGVLAAALWAAGAEADWRVPRRDVRISSTVAHDARPITLVTGLTSRSLVELAGLRLSLDDQVHDPLLGTSVDARLAELCERILLAADASPGHLPADLAGRLRDDRLTAFAEVARALAARRGHVLADARLGLTLPFWREHVGDVRVVLVTERPSELLTRTPSPLPAEHLLARWLDVVTATLAERDGVKVLDPRDIADLDTPEGVPAPATLADTPLLQLATVVDSLVRELDGESMQPVLDELFRARLRAERAAPPPSAPLGAPLRVVDDLWRDVVAVDRLRTTASAASEEASRELAAARAELESLRSLRSVRLAERLFGRG
jgi:hypothetical protein